LKEKVDAATQRPSYHAMCGRYALTLPPEAVRAYFGYVEQPNFPPRYNIAPTQPVPVVLQENHARHFRLMRWGFLPSWVKDPKEFPLVINIRSETAAEKPSFRNALKRRRCLMPADGFYEWRGKGKEREAYLAARKDRGPFAFAALWETWIGKDGSEIDTVAMVNGDANGVMSAIHHRSPVILEPSDWPVWLDPANESDGIATMLRPPPEDAYELIRIGQMVNKVSNDGPEVQMPWGEGTSLPSPLEGESGPEDRMRGDRPNSLTRLGSASPPSPSGGEGKAVRSKRAGDGGQGSLF
jgi:putative SOS response-associated peptidase YedK